ncbi:MAG: formate dehydrogenase accessory protein FdhE [Actinomycetota bacterium]
MELNQKPWTIDHIRQEMDFYKTGRPDLADLMDLYEQLFAIEAEYLPKIEMDVDFLDDEDIPAKIQAGEVLMDAGKLKVDAGLFKEILESMAAVIVETNPDFEEPLERLIDYPDLNVDTAGENPLFIKNLLKFNTQYFTKVAELIDLNSDVMFFLIYHAISPFMEKASYPFRDKINYQQWQKTFCPVCGRKPGMAFIRADDGQNVLQCQVCRTQWVYPRATCLVCGNFNNDTYKYIYDEADAAHRVYVCDSCKKYTKSTDCRAYDRDVDLEVEDLATLVLDYVAKQRGYEPGGRVTFAVKLEMPEGDNEPEMPEEITVD